MTLNDKELDMGLINDFFAHDYHDRGMVKWQGFYLSDHAAALNKQTNQLNQKYPKKAKQSLEAITEILSTAYNKKKEVTIQLKEVDKNDIILPDITTLIYGYNNNDIVIDSNRFVAVDDIRNIEYT